MYIRNIMSKLHRHRIVQIFYFYRHILCSITFIRWLLKNPHKIGLKLYKCHIIVLFQFDDTLMHFSERENSWTFFLTCKNCGEIPPKNLSFELSFSFISILYFKPFINPLCPSKIPKTGNSMSSKTFYLNFLWNRIYIFYKMYIWGIHNEL